MSAAQAAIRAGYSPKAAAQAGYENLLRPAVAAAIEKARARRADRAGRLVFAGRVGSGINQAELQRLWRKLQPLMIDKMPLAVPPPRSSRFGSPLELSRVHWVRPELMVEVKYLAWTGDNVLRQVVYEGLREDKPATVSVP